MDEDRIASLLGQMSLGEQVTLLSGEDFWSVAGNTRLGIGRLIVTDGPNGARGGGSLIGGVKAAAFPVGIALGASWHVGLVKQVGAALARETRSKGAHMLLAPTVNIHRSVTNGRNFECYAEDPVLTARLASAYIEGLQGQGVGATIKHFAGNESEIERTTMSSQIDERTLREVYLVPFEVAVKEAGVWGVMSSYNRLNGTYTSENQWLLDQVLRQDWGFDGLVMSDWFGSHSTVPTVNAGLDLEMPGPARDRGEKLVGAVERGEVDPETVRQRARNILGVMARTGALDDLLERVERAEDRPETRALIRRAGAEAAVLLKNAGLLPLAKGKVGRVAVIGPNAKSARIMGGGSAQLNPHYAVSPHDGLAEALGAERLAFAPGCTNHRFEPLVTGTFRAEYFANRSLEGPVAHTELHENGEGFLIAPVGGGTVDPQAFSVRFTGSFVPAQSGVHRVGVIAAALVKVFVDGTLVADAWSDWRKGRTFFEQGCDEVVGEVALEKGRAHEIVIELASKPAEDLEFTAFRVGIGLPMGEAEIAAAAEAARDADVALVFVGRSGEWDTEGSDLETIALPGRQDALVSAVAQANPKTIVILQTGGPVEMPWLEQVAGVLQAWYPGQEAGHAIADVLFGAAEPGGRLPQTFPVRFADNPTFSQDREIYPGLDGKVRYEEGVFVGYRHYDKAGITPLFPFGFGLSYTRFELSGFTVENGLDRLGRVRVSVGVRNMGERSGTTVIQLYVRDVEASVARPEKELKAFAKVALGAGEAQAVTFNLSPRDFAFFDVDAGGWRVEPGRFDILAGFSSADLSASAQIDVNVGRLLEV